MTAAVEVAPVPAAGYWRTNAHLIADLARLGYLRAEWLTLDPTWGRGRWWRRWRPDTLVRHDLHTLDGVDFRDLPEGDDTFDAVAFDPPYVSPGGRSTTGLPDFFDRFGMHTTPGSPAATQLGLINPGLTEVARVTRPGGLILVKVQDYISSGKLWLGTHHTIDHALSIGLRVEDRIEHITSRRAQPDRDRRCPACKGAGTVGHDTCDTCGGSGRVPSRQAHARRNYSTMLVLRKPPRRGGPR